MLQTRGMIPAMSYGRAVPDPLDAPAETPPTLDVTIAPGPPAALRVLAPLAALFLIAGAAPTIFFVKAGAWPVVGFFLIDVALVAGAFHLAYRRARYRERLRIGADGVHLVKTAPSGRRAVWSFPANAVRVDFDPDAHANNQLGLVHEGGCVRFAACLAPRERAALAEKVRASLPAYAAPR